MKLNVSFKDYIKSYILKHNIYEPKHNTKYTLDTILDVIEYILITGSSWRSLSLSIFCNKIKWQSFYYHFDKFAKHNVFECVYNNLLNEYFKVNKSGKLKHLSIDSSFIKNECSNNGAFNGYNKKKRLFKLSALVDVNGVPLSAIIKPGNMSDQKLTFINFNNMLVDIIPKTNNNKHKRYLLADSAYDTTNIHSKIKNMNITPVIWYNRRKTKDKTIIASRKFNKKENKIYKKRIVIENFFSWIYKNRRVNRRYDKKLLNYKSFLYMAFIKLILKR